jgi:MFS family permease
MAQDRHPNGSASLASEPMATEQTPLLATGDIAPTADPTVAEAMTLKGSGNGTFADDAVGDAEDEDEDESDGPPFRKWQVFWICFARVVEPMAFFSVFPYINKMAQEVGHLDEADVGFYAGLLESLFSLTQACVMIFWGMASDRLGRKPVLVFSLVGVTIATSLFGFSKTIWEMILFRCAAGIFGGTVVTMRTMLAELSSSSTQAKIFSWFAFSGNLGIFIGPLMGGAVADLAGQYPERFGHIRFLRDYPYALCSLIVGFLGLIAVFTSALYIEETLEKEPCSEDGVVKPKREGQGILDIVKTPGVGMVLYVYAHIMLLALAYTAILPVFWFTSVELGGFGFTPVQISLMLADNGVAQASWLLFVFPPLQKRWGTNKVLRVCAVCYPFFFAVCPLGNALLRAGHDLAFWISAPLILAIGSGVSMSFTAIQLSLNDISPSPAVLGTLNGLALTGASVIRAFAPILFSSLFALGAKTQLLDGYAIWVLMTLIALGFTVVARYMPEPKKKPAPAQREQESAPEVTG